MRYCADTWFLLQAFSKHPKAIGLLAQVGDGKANILIPLTVVAETTKKLMQRAVPERAIEEFFQGVEASQGMSIVGIDRVLAREAAKISLSFSISLMDAFVASTAKLTGCKILLSQDSDFRLLAKKKYVKVQGWPE
ncbi:hypothetical protein CMO91_00915 [Candidatus Woesearchaeota archaeon]|nr:hypothetical protein [Candidatus Woesearchaeota archaeon]|tara:strand:- start:818 stop:1225 length:408 start_codon:yes stop_codon:yes gene_type:complete